MPFLEKENVRIPYETWAENGPWVTLVNGYTRTLTDFKAMGRYLGERGFRALAFDNRGAGRAECLPTFTLDELVDDILSLWKQLGIETSHLFGISYGGVLTAMLAAREPQRVRSLVLASTPVSAKELAVELRGPSRDPRRLQSQLMRYFSPQFLAGNKILVQGFIRQMGKIFQEPDTALGALAQRSALEGMELTPLLPQITSRTLVLHGEEDRIVSVDSAKRLTAAIHNAKLQIFPDVGHLLLAEMPMKLYETSETFFRSMEPNMGTSG